MAWSDLTFTGCSVLTAAQMTQLQANFAALAHGHAGAPAIVAGSLMWTGQASGAGLHVSSAARIGRLTLTEPPQIPNSGTLYAPDPGWTYVGSAGAPPFQNGWGNVGGSDQGARFRKSAEGWVYLQGAINNSGTAGTAIFTLPVNYRPAGGRVGFGCAYDGTAASLTGFVAIGTNGDVVISVKAAGGTVVWLGGIQFLAEA